jgi:hypothetical protein
VEDQSCILELRSQPEAPPTVRLAPETQRMRVEVKTTTIIAFTANTGLIFLQTKQKKLKNQKNKNQS